MGLRLLHLNLHGLIRSHDLELGRDADTGGQTLYVIELVKGLAARPEVDQVDLVTRLIQDRRVSNDYSLPKESISSKASIIRLPFGPKRYLRKELLWPYLDDLADRLVKQLQDQPRLPDWIHAHYADAGYVGALVSRRIGIPLVFTGHSLGREKQRRLLEAGVDHDQIEQTYSISKRIEAEELALAHADLVITSTQQEANQQYSRYGRFESQKAQVVPPGVDSSRFYPRQLSNNSFEIDQLFNPFLRNTSLPPLLTIARAVRRKNIPALVEAYGRSSVLRKRHNLLLVLGSRDDPRQLDKQQREVFQQVFDLVDRFDLYGSVAYPKQHRREQIPDIYRWAANRFGLFVNSALTEPFGLTLLEAAACGLPTVATDDGGPREILSRCENGLLADVTDIGLLQDALEQAGSDKKQWKLWSENGIEGISRHFSWDAHVFKYLALMQNQIKISANCLWKVSQLKEKNTIGESLVLLDLDTNLETADGVNLTLLRNKLDAMSQDKSIAIGVLTGRSIESARLRYRELHFPNPTLWITRAGTEIYYRFENQVDRFWQSSLAVGWSRKEVELALADMKEHLNLQELVHQGPFKISYLLKQPAYSVLPLVVQRLRKFGQPARPLLRCHWYLDIVPLRASRTEAIRFLALRWGIPLEKVFVFASQHGDAELIRGLTNSVVLGDHDPSLEELRHQSSTFFSSKISALGVLDGLNHYGFF